VHRPPASDLPRERRLRKDDFRRRVLEALGGALGERAGRAREELRQLDAAAEGETKSSAGDKYETAREMIAQARELQARLLREAEAGLDWVAVQDSGRTREAVAAGALFRTDDGWHLVCPMPGDFRVETENVRGLSLGGPLGTALKGARAGESREFRGRRIEVREVV